MANDICVRLGRRIRLLRSKRGWTQQQLADMSQIGRDHLSRLENGEREIGLLILERIAQAFEISLAELLKEVDKPG
ncbi:MAG: helix-turn-helix transcriptional regulator [Acidobacteriaceae bacterium]|nr:helix-turn-helix transcriptional regulator [Acidobacteriaceae bacterium]